MILSYMGLTNQKKVKKVCSKNLLRAFSVGDRKFHLRAFAQRRQGRKEKNLLAVFTTWLVYALLPFIKITPLQF